MSLGFALFVVVLLLLMAVFTGGEVAFLSVNRYSLREKAKLGGKSAKLVLYFLEHPARFFSLIQIGNSGINIALGAVVTTLAINYSKEAVFFANIGVTFIVILFGEIVPKSLASRNPQFSYYLAPLFRLLYFLFWPAIVLLSFVSRVMVQLLGGEVGPQGPFVTEEEIKTLVSVGEETGAVEPQEKQMIQRVFEFSETIVREVMVPRPDMVALPKTASLEKAIAAILRYGHSRIPVYEENMDKIVGLLYAKDLLQYWNQPPPSLDSVLRAAFFVPEIKKVTDLFAEMRRRKVHLAIVVDEYGGVAGLVTIEDLLEELVGEIQDEYDREEPFVQVVSPNVTLMDARLNIDEAGRLLGENFQADNVDTLGGLVVHSLGRVPDVGEKVSIQGFRFEVVDVQGHRIQKVKVTKEAESA